MRREKTYRLKKKNFLIVALIGIVLVLLATNIYTKHLLVKATEEKIIKDVTLISRDNEVAKEDTKESK